MLGEHLGAQAGSHLGAQGEQLGSQLLPHEHGSQKLSVKQLHPAKLNAPTKNSAAQAIFKCFI
jgi:hypothetical protein